MRDRSRSPERREDASGYTTPSTGGASSTCVTPELERLGLQHAAPSSDSVPLFGADEAGSSGAAVHEAPAPPLPPVASGDCPPTSPGLMRHAKHVFVFSTAGKPIFSQHGSEEELGELMATAKAIMSVAQSQGQSLRYLRSGRHVIAFLERSPLCLLAVSALAEPPAVLRMQLALVHGAITSLLTAPALTAVFKRNPGYDVRKLLGGTDPMLRSLVDSFVASPAALLGAYPSLPMPKGVRVAVSAALAAAVQASGALFGLVVSAGHVVCMTAAAGGGRHPALQQWDVLLLLNFLAANEGLKRAETFSPVCLPNYNPAGHLHAYIQYVSSSTSTAIVLLAGGTAPDFHALAAARAEMQAGLEAMGALQAVMEAARDAGGAASMLHPAALPVLAGGGALGESPLIHFAYKLTATQQFVMSPFPLCDAMPNLQQEAVVAYGQLRAGMYDHAGEHTAGPLQRLRYEARVRCVVMASCGAEAELYMVLDPLTGKEEALRACSALYGWLRGRHDELFRAV